MSEWKEFAKFVQVKAGKSPCGIGAGNSMLFSSSMSGILYRMQAGYRMKLRRRKKGKKNAKNHWI